MHVQRERDNLGTITHFYFKGKEKVYHREWDKPAIESYTGLKQYFQHGILDRENGPAIVYPDGTSIYYKNGKKHRIGKPAVEKPNGYMEFWQDGKEHNENGPWITNPKGLIKEEWKYWGQLHNLNGPSIVFSDGRKYWYAFNRRHNYHGPWTITSDGKNLYALHGCDLSEQEFLEITQDRTLAAISAIIYSQHQNNNLEDRRIRRNVLRVLEFIGTPKKTIDYIKKSALFLRN